MLKEPDQVPIVIYHLQTQYSCETYPLNESWIKLAVVDQVDRAVFGEAFSLVTFPICLSAAPHIFLMPELYHTRILTASKSIHSYGLGLFQNYIMSKQAYHFLPSLPIMEELHFVVGFTH